MQRITTDEINSKIGSLEEKIDSNAETQANSITELQEHVDDGNKQLVVAVKGVQEDLKFGWFGNCLFELKEKVSQVFINTGTTFSAVQRIETILLSRSDKTLFRTFVLEDALGRKTQHDLACISSWENLDAMVEIIFRDLPGHEKVARKEYVFQDPKTNREIKRATPWSIAFLPDQNINMGLLFRKRASRRKRFYCPYCHVELKQSQEGLTPCQNGKCGMSHQRITETIDINEDEDRPAFELFDGSSSDSDNHHEESEPKETSTILVKAKKSVTPSKPKEDMSVFKRVIVVEVEMNIIQSKVPEPKPAKPTSAGSAYYPRTSAYNPYVEPPYGYYNPPPASPRPRSRYTSRDPWKERMPSSPRYTSVSQYASPRRVKSRPISEYESRDYVDYTFDEVIYRHPVKRDVKDKTRGNYGYRPPSSSYYSENYAYEPDDTPMTPRRRRTSSSTPQRPSSSQRSATKKEPPPTRKATEEDARKHGIPLGYSLKNWDPEDEPIMLLGSVFDPNSLGKWIYDWTVYCHGPATPLAYMAGELWLLLIQLSSKAKRAEECLLRIRKEENRELIEDFIESAERLFNKLKKLLKECEIPMLKAGRRKTKKPKTEDAVINQVSKSDVLLDTDTEKAGEKAGERSEQSTQSKITSSSATTIPASEPDDNGYGSDCTVKGFATKKPVAKESTLEESTTEEATARETTTEAMTIEVTKTKETATKEDDDWTNWGKKTKSSRRKEVITLTAENQPTKAAKDSAPLGRNAGEEFVHTMFGRGRLLDQTEKFVASINLWSLRFDANCEDIVSLVSRDPAPGRWAPAILSSTNQE